jgi:hypothetical protein
MGEMIANVCLRWGADSDSITKEILSAIIFNFQANNIIARLMKWGIPGNGSESRHTQNNDQGNPLMHRPQDLVNALNF